MGTGNMGGGCYCGEIRYVIQGDFQAQCFCHCRSCRIASGAPVVAWGTIHPDRFKVVRGNLSLRVTPTGVTRGFCGQCGTGISYSNSARPGEVDITLASLNPDVTVQPQYHLWVAEKLPWVCLDDGLPQYQEWRSNA